MSKNNSFETGRNKRSKKAVIFDLDGTLTKKDDSSVNHDVAEKVHKAKSKGRDVVILTARSAHDRPQTKKWLHENSIPYDALIMRSVGDDRKDKKVKKDLLKGEILPYFDVKKAYDDKKKNVKMFRKEGIDAKRVRD